MSIKVVKVALSETSSAFDMLYSYIVPDELTSSIDIGYRVSVPFGKGNILQVGMVLEMELLQVVPNNYKRIYSIEDTKPILNSEQIQLVYQLVETTFCTFYEAIRTILPAMFTMKVSHSYKVNWHLVESWFLDKDELDFINLLNSKKDILSVSK